MITKQERAALIILSVLTLIAALMVATHPSALSQIGAWVVLTGERILQAFSAVI